MIKKTNYFLVGLSAIIIFSLSHSVAFATMGLFASSSLSRIKVIKTQGIKKRNKKRTKKLSKKRSKKRTKKLSKKRSKKRTKKLSKKRSKKRTKKLSKKRSKKRYSRYKKIKYSKKKRKKRSSRRYKGPFCYQYPAAKLLNRSRPYQHYITSAARRNRLSSHLITAIITAESCFRVRVKSPKGAVGLMQLMPATGRRFGVPNRMRYVPANNIAGGSQYLSFLLRRYQGNLYYAIAAYNAGEGNVDRYKGIPPFKETRNYVYRVMNVYRRLQAFKKRYKPHAQARLIAQATQSRYRSRYTNNKRKQQLALLRIQRQLKKKRLNKLAKQQRNRRSKKHQQKKSKEIQYVRIDGHQLNLNAVRSLLD